MIDEIVKKEVTFCQLDGISAVDDSEQPELAPVNTANFALRREQDNYLYKQAKIYSSSDIVPTTYRGNVSNCFVACQIANRMNLEITFVMQNLWVVQGRPSWAGQACKAMIDGCGRFKSSEYVFIGEPDRPSWGCYLQALNISTGKMVKGTPVTMQMATNEGWLSKNGSKWKTMPEQMMKYRAAAFFARSECPEILMGFQTADEVEDTQGAEPEMVKVSLRKGEDNG
jgi:hypothetical protein